MKCTWNSIKIGFSILAFCVLLSTIEFGGRAGAQSEEKAPADTAWPFKKKSVHEGVAVEFSMDPVQADKKFARKFQEDDDIIFRFSISDTTTGSPIAGVHPAAWMYLRAKDEAVDAKQCARKVERIVGGSLFSRPELDLNVYYVLALNNDASLTVVDPLFEFGSPKLVALVPLKSPGEDWTLTSNQARVFVSMPDSNQVAVVDTAAWKVTALLDAGSRPARLALQPDEQYLWVGTGDSGVTAINTSDLKITAHIPTGKGPHQIALSNDNRFAFITNADEDTVSIIDIRKLEKVKDIKTGPRPASIAFSSISQMAYVASEGDGAISIIDGNRQEMVAQMEAEPGLGQIRFAPGGRLGFVVNPIRDVVHIFDVATNRIVQTGDVEDEPDQIAFSDELAYVHHRGSETVLMIPLDGIGVEGKPVPVVDFPGGESSFIGPRPSPADAIVQAPGAYAMLIANPRDQAIYFYKEGMAAPMGRFSNYSREPRAVLVVDRSLKERSPGVYETTAKLRRPGVYDVAFFLDSPRIVHCFEVKVASRK